MSDRHTEIEYKFNADGAQEIFFVDAMMSLKPVCYKRVDGADDYYAQNGNVIRHRTAGEHGCGELTVKRRKSESSTTDRFEIDVMFSKATTDEDVRMFLELSGWKREMSIFKDAHIFTFKDGLSCVLYSCWTTHPHTSSLRTFMEIEVAKATAATKEADIARLDKFTEKVSAIFGFGAKLELSLYEIFSGNRYLVYEDKQNSKAKERSTPVA